MFDQILVPLDGSELAERVLPYVEELAKKFGSRLVILQTISSAGQIAGMTQGGGLEAGVIGYPDSITEIQEAERKSGSEYLNRVAARLTALGVTVSTVVAEGNPADSIMAESKKEGIELIAISTHGRSGFGRVLFGSVADKVIRDSGIPVLVIRPPDK
ncbi:MAG: universal stress protein [Dehalococcoidia bacterium]|nr:universal stress protein [Dehalococcoidia bacterium]